MSTLGLRLLNPFDLEKTSDIEWHGQVHPGSDPTFCQFDTMENGIRAGVIDIVNMNGRDGLKTLRQMAEKYAPPSKNDTTAYIKTLCAHTGFDPDEEIELGKPEDARDVALAFLAAEQGAAISQISQVVIDAGIVAGLKALSES